MNRSIQALYSRNRESIEKNGEADIVPSGNDKCSTGGAEIDGKRVGDLDASSKKRVKKEKTSTSKEPKKRKTGVLRNGDEIPNIRLSDLGGIDQCVESLLELVAMPLLHPEIYMHTGVSPPRYANSFNSTTIPPITKPFLAEQLAVGESSFMDHQVAERHH
jgi:ribosome biogenesis ATPase